MILVCCFSLVDEFNVLGCLWCFKFIFDIKEYYVVVIILYIMFRKGVFIKGFQL